MTKITASALKHKYPNWNSIVVQGSDDEDKIVNFDVPNVKNPPKESEWPVIQKEHEDYLKSIQYQRDRAVAYDPIPEQLDQIYHDIDGWKARIKAVKDKFPKP